jgi:predicted amidophosphoribosyltransferase
MICKCPSCGGAINYTDEDAGRIEACPHCSERLTLPASEDNVATRQRVLRSSAAWTLVKVLGVLILIVSSGWLLLLLSTILTNNATANTWSVAAFASIPAVLGMVFGAALFTFARKAGIGFVCSRCGKPTRANAEVCANCGAVFDQA